MTSARRPLDLATTEAQWQQQVVDLARLTGWRVHHTRPAQNRHGEWSTPIQGDPGFPDLVLAGHDELYLVELKAERGRLTADQMAWITALCTTGCPVEVWRPSDWPEVERTLTRRVER